MDWADSRSYRVGVLPHSPGICAIMRAETHPGHDQEFERLIRAFADEVRDGEVGCDSYVVTRVMGSRTQFAVHAQFTNMEAFERHADTEHLQAAMPRLSALLATPISMEIFFAV